MGVNKCCRTKKIPLLGGFYMLGKHYIGGKGGRHYYEGRHYCRSAHLHKQSFEALIQYRILKEVNIDGFSAAMKTRIADLGEDLNCTNLDELVNEEELSFIEKILKTSNTVSQMTISYIKDVGNLLALIASVRESKIEQRKDERVMLPDVFAFGHPNYGRYLTYQHITLSNLHLENPRDWEGLVKDGFGVNLSSQPFSTEHGDLIIETIINREVSRGSMQGGYSTSFSAMNKFVKNNHLLAKLRTPMKKKLRVLTPSKHKKTKLSGKHLNELTIVSMVQPLERYLNPFDSQPARNFKTVEVIEENIIKGLLSSSILG